MASKLYDLWVYGKFYKGKGKTYKIVSPHTQQVYAEIQGLNSEEMKKVVEEALKAKHNMRELTIADRIKFLNNFKNALSSYRKEIIDALMHESGKSIHYAEGEFDATLKRFEFIEREVELLHPETLDGNAGYGTSGKYAVVVKEPAGIVLAIAPFNYPLLTLMNKVIPALLGGNAVIAKPSTQTSLSSYWIGKAFEESGFPKAGLQIVVGENQDVENILVESPHIQMISFTGSTYVGKEIIAKKAGMKKLHLELGGKGTALVLDDKNVEHYAKEIASGAFKFSGQRCDALSRVIIPKQYWEKLKNELLKEVKNWKSDGFDDPNTKIVPLINKKAYSKVEELMNDALEKGAKIIYEGMRDPSKNLFEPVILENVTENMRIFWEEVFGPVLSVVFAEDEEEAISLAKKNNYGLDMSIFSQDIAKAVSIAQQMGEGAVTINAHPSHAIGYFPFGGNKDSGMGREGVKYSLMEMINLKSIVIKR
ncbi:MAG: aldehyde dehydrogenase family protein [Candidatus Nanohaloarchaeota archaeon]|nr:aldehyde dehydrogenase family protein [Candidatus Nanohaloarchaeota archaeon]